MPFDIKTHLYLIAFIEFAFLLQVYEHKEARSGKVCPVRIGPLLLLDLKRYAGLLIENTVPYLFQTQTGHFLTPSVSVKWRVKTHKYIQTDIISQQHYVKLFRLSLSQYLNKTGTK